MCGQYSEAEGLGNQPLEEIEKPSLERETVGRLMHTLVSSSIICSFDNFKSLATKSEELLVLRNGSGIRKPRLQFFSHS
jgi:hypothetical protein